MSAFHEVTFPVSVSLGSIGGPERRTEIIELHSGAEERNSPWAQSRRRYDASFGIRSIEDIETVLAFFEARMGRLYGFRWKDHADCKSCSHGSTVSELDQNLGSGDGSNKLFQLKKTYESGVHAYERPITKPVAGSVLIAVDGVLQVLGLDYALDANTGLVSFEAGREPAPGTEVTAGYSFEVPVRFDSDYLAISMEAFRSGAIQSIPVLEIR